MVRWNCGIGWKSGLAVAAVSALFLSAGCGGDDGGGGQSAQSTQASDASVTAAKVKVAAEEVPLPKNGKIKGLEAPKKAALGMLFHDENTGREWIYDGTQWVPHDGTVESYYAELDKEVAAKRAADRSALLTAEAVCADPTAPACTPTGAHGKHGGYACSVCHYVAGRLAFNPTGPAYGVGYPAPSFDATAKTCSNVACHTVAPGSFSYYFPGGDGEPALNTVYYGGGAPRPTPSWYATGAIGCSACHDNPPRNGSTGSNVWHSGLHANQDATGAANQCQFCHPNATGSNGAGTAITVPSMHGNGVANVQARFTTSCFGCH